MTTHIWTPEISVGDDEIDRQHQHLFTLAERIHAMTGREGRDKILDALDDVVDYVLDHFAFEEKLLIDRGFAEIDAHREKHRAIRDRVHIVAAIRDFITVKMLDDLMSGIVRHISVCDRDYAGQL